MANYIDIIGSCYPDVQAYIAAGGDATLYSEIIWVTLPAISQAELDACEPFAEIDTSLVPVEIAGTDNGSTPPNEGDTLVWDPVSQAFVAQAFDTVILAAVQQSRTTDLDVQTASFIDVTYDLVDVETDTNVIEVIDTTHTQVKQPGLYQINYSNQLNNFNATLDCESQLVVNDVNVVPGSLIRSNTYQAEIIPSNRSVVVELLANDTIKTQIRCADYDSGDSDEYLRLIASCVFSIVKLDGVRGAAGAKGDPGTPGEGGGNTINLQEEGSNVSGGPFDIINFIGGGITVVDGGGGVGQVIVDPPVAATTPVMYVHNGSATQTFTSNWINVTFPTTVRSDTGYVYGGGSTSIAAAGWYEIEYDLSIDVTSATRSSSETKLTVNGSDVDGSFAYGYHRTSSNGEDSMHAKCLVNITAGATVVVQARRIAGATLQTIEQGCRLYIKKVD
jgi:hypothetical protein